MCAKLQARRSGWSLLSYLSKKLVHHASPRSTEILVSSATRVRSQLFARYSHSGDGKGRRKKDNVLTMTNSQYLDFVYQAWLKDPKSVSSSWDAYFKLIHAEPVSESKPSSFRASSSTSLAPSNLTVAQPQISPFVGESVRAMSGSEIQGEQYINGTLDINSTIRAYQTRGHLIANVDPLGIQNAESKNLQGTANLPPSVVVRQHLKGITEADMNKEFPLAQSTRIGGDKRSLPLREIIMRLNKVYCGHLGLEYTYIHDLNMLDWLREKFEVPDSWTLSADHRKWIWKSIMRAVTFESFLARKYGTEKRFGLEGGEAFIASMEQCLETSAEHGVESIVIGMAHRGRLSTLHNICAKPLNQLFTQFNPISLEGFGSGDVKYHLGTHAERLLERYTLFYMEEISPHASSVIPQLRPYVRRCQKTIQISIMANPSHLEAVDSVVVGRVRAEQIEKDDAEGKRSLAVIVHGDAAFAGQGIVYETMHLTNLPEYTTGGVLHVVINNQIGFTTDPRYSRSSAHCTDVARVVNAPIFHIHGDDPDLVVYCSKVACEYRAVFHNDVVLDIVGYRRNGHNEMDEPMLTQPLMYKRIKAHPNVLTIYSEKLYKEGVITEDYAKEEIGKYLGHCEQEFQAARTISSMNMNDWHDVPWTEFFANQSPKNPIPPTGIDLSTVKEICEAFSTPPPDIAAHAQIYRVMDRRKNLTETRQIDWAMGECLAFVSLLKEGHQVRLSGQDVERGTFSHRMHIVHDQNRDMVYKNILRDVFPGQALYTVSNSSLSEYGVCGFELGYSAYNHNSLILWEAQFGDFANTCQVILDSLLCSGQTKWGRQVGLVLLLPHGMEGQGPEHSSARLERFLQLSDDDVTHLPGAEAGSHTGDSINEIMTQQLFEINWIVCNLTTPANLCHVLRRQILMPFRKPLVIMSPKSLLRHPMAQSSFDEMAPGTTFTPLYPDTLAKPDDVKKVLICSGKVFYDLLALREEKHLVHQIAIIRIEQICPFPYHLLAQEVSKYPKAKIQWIQEEHKNQGAYYYVRDRIALALGIPLEKVEYVGRSTSASPATGSKIIYKNEYDNMMAGAMNLD